MSFGERHGQFTRGCAWMWHLWVTARLVFRFSIQPVSQSGCTTVLPYCPYLVCVLSSDFNCYLQVQLVLDGLWQGARHIWEEECRHTYFSFPCLLLTSFLLPTPDCELHKTRNCVQVMVPKHIHISIPRTREDLLL